ncbi:hypothetical protein WJX74_005734 [Apatococcus lobatus]|uniref:Nudix hydrolase domain-containing protein n=1 Tax=Apatococcus lobatus TaxID=904363 RepID=A0AAW1Q1W0_9CHLO
MCNLDLFVSRLTSFSEANLKPVADRAAAVLMLLEEADGAVHITLTQRSGSVRTHQGEVCLPGGKRDPADRSNVATALREANEEIGLDPENVRIIGCLQPFLSRHMLSVTPVVGILTQFQDFCPSAAEVAVVFRIPLALVLEEHTRHIWRDLQWELPGSLAPAWHRVHYFDIEGQNVWGLTAAMLIELAEQGFRRQAAFQVNIPEIQPDRPLIVEGGQLSQAAASQTFQMVRM